jgi:hypothetical protein
MCEGLSWDTDDSLGIGGILTDACRISQLSTQTNLPESDKLEVLLRDAEAGLDMFVRRGYLNYPASNRLAFRELGLSIGIKAIKLMKETINQHPEHFPNVRPLLARLSALTKYRQLSGIIEQFWLESTHQQSHTWQDHLDINSVMLATSLVPAGYLNFQ